MPHAERFAMTTTTSKPATTAVPNPITARRYALTDDQQQLRDSVARFVNDHHDFQSWRTALRSPEAMRPVLWQQMAELGFHVLRLTDIKVPKQRSFEEMRPQLESQLRDQQAQRKFAETADAFSNAVYEQSDSLKGVSERFKLEVRSATGISRQPAPGATGVLANPKFLASLFSADSLEKKRNTEAVEAGPGVLVAGRVTQYQPAATLPLESVKPQVIARLKAARGADLARERGAEQLKAFKADPASARLGASLVVSRRNADKLPPELLEAALRADPAALPALTGVDLGAQGYAVVKVVRSIPREAPAEAAARAERQQYSQWWTQAELLAYYNLLKNRFKVSIKVPDPAAKAP